ncbi:MAG: BON domain-containing protein [Pseudomonadota bacterium]
MSSPNTSKLPFRSLLIAAAAAMALTACGRNDERTVGEAVDSSIAKSEQAAADASKNIQQGAAEVKADASAAADRAGQAVANATDKAGTAVEKMADKVSDKVSDAGITASVNAELAKDETLSALRINVDTVDGKVSLRGTAPSSQARERATMLAKAVKGVSSVDNQLDVRG